MDWIRVNDRLPENGERVICYNGYIYTKYYDSVFYDGDRHWTGAYIGEIEKVTHWMPLPEPPKCKKYKLQCDECGFTEESDNFIPLTKCPHEQNENGMDQR